jgi:hypothetical protein
MKWHWKFVGLQNNVTSRTVQVVNVLHKQYKLQVLISIRSGISMRKIVGTAPPKEQQESVIEVRLSMIGSTWKRITFAAAVADRSK